MAVVGERGLNEIEFKIGNFVISAQSDFAAPKEQRIVPTLVAEFGSYIFLARADKMVQAQ